MPMLVSFGEWLKRTISSMSPDKMSSKCALDLISMSCHILLSKYFVAEYKFIIL